MGLSASRNDAEGYTGVGAIGYFDKAQRKFTFLEIPENVDARIAFAAESGRLRHEISGRNKLFYFFVLFASKKSKICLMISG